MDRASRPPLLRREPYPAFTLVELLVSAVVVLMLLGAILLITGSMGTTIGRATSRLDAFTAARTAFDLVVRRLGQATLNPTYGYLDSQGRASSDPYYANGTAPGPFVPASYGRQSDLQFLVNGNVQVPGGGQEVYFVAPLSGSGGPDTTATTGMLNAAAFFVRYGTNQDFLPPTVAAGRARYRLMQAFQPTNRLTVFSSVAAGDGLWLTEIANTPDLPGRTALCVSPLADNVLVLAVWPRLSEHDDPAGNQLTGDYTYNSHPAPAADPSGQPDTANQLPPVMQVTMVGRGEASVARRGGTASAPPAVLSAALLNGAGLPKFAVSTTTQQQADLNDLSARLTGQSIRFEIFTTSVPMREPRWGLHAPTP